MVYHTIMESVHKEILKYCILSGSTSIGDLSKKLDISVPTVTKLVQELVAEGFLHDEGKMTGAGAGGRRPSIYGLNPEAGYFLGLDIARQHFHLAISDFSGKVLCFIQDVEFILKSEKASITELCDLVKKMASDKGVDWGKVLGVGISLSGRINPEKGFSPTYYFSEDFPLKDLFRNEFGVPVIIENDSRAMTVSEYKALGPDADPNMLFINLSWGLGMGVIIDSELYYGKTGYSGEIGHFPILDNDIICRCGKVGCLETGASGSALKRWIMERIKSGRQTSLNKVLETNGDIRLNNILYAVEEEDVLAIEGIGVVGEILGRAIAGLINVFNPGLVIIGGRLVVGGDYLMLPIKTAVNRHSLSKVSAETKLRFAKLGREAASIGDCLIIRRHFIEKS